MNDRYKVDLSAMDHVVRQLNQVVDDMSGPATKAKYETYLAPGVLGEHSDDFKEEATLRQAHNGMKTFLEDVVKQLEHLIDDTAKKTGGVRDKYRDQEGSTTQTFNGSAGGMKG